MTAAPYQPFYCEENAWHLASQAVAAAGAGERQSPDVDVVVLSNPTGTCAVWCQRAAPDGGESPVVWDYHVVVRHGPDIVDPDCVLGPRLPVGEWLDASFPLGDRVFEAYRPQLRLVPAATYLAHFASDRRHMRASDGTYRAPPPPWPSLVAADGSTHSLPALLDFQNTAPWLDASPWQTEPLFRKALGLAARRHRK